MKEPLKKIFPFSLIFFETRIFSTFTLTDLFLVLFIMAVFFSKREKNVKYKGRRAWNTLLFLFFLASLVGINGIGRNYFLISAYVNTELRIILYGVALILLPKTFTTQKDISDLIKGLTVTLFIFALFGFIDYIFLKLGINFSVSISFSTGNEETRLRGLVSEPAHFCIFVGLIISVLLYYYNSLKKSMPFATMACFFFSIIMVVLSFSMVGFIFAFLIIFYLLLIYYRRMPPKARRLSLLFLPPIMVMFFVVVITLNQERIDRIWEFNDASSSQRLLGTWTLALYGLEKFDSYNWGLGSGQSGSFIEQSGILLDGFFTDNDLNLSNTLSLLLMQNGIIGLTLFCLFVYAFFRRRSQFLFVIIIAYSFSICEYGALLWSYLVLSEIIMSRVNKNRVWYYCNEIKV